MSDVAARPTARERARAELTAEILEAGRCQLAEVGPAALSLRSVAREVGMVSSAVYRYFPSRDHLLTALIIEAYNAVGEVAEQADASRASTVNRWLRVCRAVRGWALAHPHAYALIYGSPVPAYQAPIDTIEPAARVLRVLRQIVTDGFRAGEVAVSSSVKVPRSLRPDLERVRDKLFHDLPDEVIAAGMLAWTAMLGAISLELFGHLTNVVTDHDEYFEHQMRRAFEPLLVAA